MRLKKVIYIALFASTILASYLTVSLAQEYNKQTSIEVVPSSQAIQNIYQNHTHMFLIALISFFLTLFLCMALLLQPYTKQAWAYWSLSATFSALAFLSSFIMLYMHYHFAGPCNIKDSARVYSKEDVNLFLFANAEQRKISMQDEHLIPTGILIKSLVIQKDNTLSIAGSLWQTYPKNSTLKKEINILNATKTEIKPTYQKETNQGVVYGYDFQADLAEYLDYTHFPLDRQQLSLELTHSSLVEPVILIPDFASWKSDDLNTIGIEPTLKPLGLVIENSFFSYTVEKSVTTKGIQDYVFANDFPILNFNMNIKRKVVNLLILVFLPVITILVLSFAFLLMFRRLFSRPHSYITINAAILFALIVSHQRLRDLIPSSVPSFPEYAYFLSYLIILFNIMLAVRYIKTLGEEGSIKSMPRETFLFRTMYWPFVSVAFLIITASFFV